MGPLILRSKTKVSMGMGINPSSSGSSRRPLPGAITKEKESQMTWKSRLISAALAVGILAAFALSAGTDWYW